MGLIRGPETRLQARVYIFLTFDNKLFFKKKEENNRDSQSHDIYYTQVRMCLFLCNFCL